MGLGLDRIKPTKNTANRIADALRSAIVQGKLTSGQSLKQDEIAAEFQVSKIPVREALVQLQTEGLVDFIPNRGAMVTRLTLDEVKEIYTIRIALEPIALRAAAPHLTNHDFRQLETILSRIDDTTDMTQWAELNWEFHSLLYAPSGMERLITITKNLHHNVARYLLTNYLKPEQITESQRQHREMVTLIKQGEIDRACDLLREHLGDPVDIFASFLQADG